MRDAANRSSAGTVKAKDRSSGGIRGRSRYLVTGGCGFIGSHLADRLVAQGDQVRILDNLSSGRLDHALTEAEVIVGDVSDAPTVRRALHHVDGCFHLAAVASVARCNTEPLAANRTNLAGTLNVLSIAGTRGVPVVYASSGAVYGANPATPLAEISATHPLSVYAADKLVCELHASVASHLHGISTVGLRLFNVYGPRQDPSSPYSGVILIFISHARKRQELEIFGDGEQVRDFVFVDDVVSAFIAAMEKQHRGRHDRGRARAARVPTGRPTRANSLRRSEDGGSAGLDRVPKAPRRLLRDRTRHLPVRRSGALASGEWAGGTHSGAADRRASRPPMTR
jgi:UDP-glucose 4-epimerase